MTLSNAEFWLLTLVAELWYPLCILSADNLDEILNTPHVHGLRPPELTETLESLFQRGDIVAERLGSARMFRPTRHQLTTALSEEHGPQSLYYGLTVSGAARWEAQAHPDWSRFLDESIDSAAQEAEASAGERAILAEWLARQSNDPFHVPIQASDVWEMVTPWHATYWKTLPCGYRIRLRLQDERMTLMAEPGTRPDHPRTWWSNYLTDCYNGPSPVLLEPT